MKSTKIKTDYDSILNFWAYLTDGDVVVHGDESVVLQDYSESIAYRDKKDAALVAFECIKQWAEDNDEAMEFIKGITQFNA